MIDYYDICVPENSCSVYLCKMTDGTMKNLQVFYDVVIGDTYLFDYDNVRNNIEYGESDIEEILECLLPNYNTIEISDIITKTW